MIDIEEVDHKWGGESHIYNRVRYSGSVEWERDEEPDPELEEMLGFLLSRDELMVHHDGRFLVICNDVFAWGCADAEPITMMVIKELFFMVIQDWKYGSLKWCCRKRNSRPQLVIERDMKQDGTWTKELERLPSNYYWDRVREKQGGHLTLDDEISKLNEGAEWNM